jgi:streptogramin lyase
MFGRVPILAVVALLLATAAPASHRDPEPSVRIGGTPLELLAARGSLWVLTCDRGCTGEARHSTGRIIRIDPQSARVVESAVLPRPHALAVGASGVYAIDFWRNTVQRIDPCTLRVVRTLKLRLPFRFSPRDNAFLPFAVTVGRGAVWIATDRGALVRVDLQLRRAVATVPLPFDAFGGMAVGPGAVWLAESLAGVYRIDPRTDRVVARIRTRNVAGGFDAGQVVVPSRRRVLIVGGKTSGEMLTRRNVLARIDSRHNRVEGVTPLQPGPLAVTFGEGSLWVARIGGTGVVRIDPSTGEVIDRLRGKIGSALALADGHIWTVLSSGTLRELK